MAADLLCFLLILSSFSSLSIEATYCVCKDGASNILQNTLDYACGAGADCTPIMQNGPCFQPNTVKDHCSYAVNSYFQRRGQATGTCDFSSTATISQISPAPQNSTCVFPSTSVTGIPTTPVPGTTTSPANRTPTGTAPASTTPASTTPTTGVATPAFGSGLPPLGMTDSSLGVVSRSRWVWTAAAVAAGVMGGWR